MRQFVIKMTTLAVMQWPFCPRRQRIDSLHEAMRQVVFDRHRAQGLGKEPTSGESRLVVVVVQLVVMMAVSTLPPRLGCQL